MYKITNIRTNQVAGFAEKLNYIKYDSTHKVFLKALTENAADGIVVDGEVYSINDHEIPNIDQARIEIVDNGEYLFNNHNETVKNTSDVNVMQQLWLDSDNTTNSIEEALMDLDNQMAGGE